MFTRQGQDIDSANSGGQYDFLMREFNPVQSRWWTPDPSGLAAVNPANPETWGRYAYVGGMPMQSVDPLGLCDGSECTPQAISGWGGTLTFSGSSCAFCGMSTGVMQLDPNASAFGGTGNCDNCCLTTGGSSFGYGSGVDDVPANNHVGQPSTPTQAPARTLSLQTQTSGSCGWNIFCHFFEGFTDFALNNKPSGLIRMGATEVVGLGAVSGAAASISGTTAASVLPELAVPLSQLNATAASLATLAATEALTHPGLIQGASDFLQGWAPTPATDWAAAAGNLASHAYGWIEGQW